VALPALSANHSPGCISQPKPVTLGVRSMGHEPVLGPSAIVRGLPWITTDHNRHIPLRVGCAVRKATDSGGIDIGVDRTAYQLPRDPTGISDTKALSPALVGPVVACINGDGERLPPQLGSLPIAGSSVHMLSLRETHVPGCLDLGAD
jgi:hypothetical protein